MGVFSIFLILFAKFFYIVIIMIHTRGAQANTYLCRLKMSNDRNWSKGGEYPDLQKIGTKV